MEISQNVIIGFIVAAALIVGALLLFGRGRRNTKAKLGTKGVEFESANEEDGAQTSTIKGVKIKDSENTNIETRERGAHVEDVEVDSSKDANVKAGKGD